MKWPRCNLNCCDSNEVIDRNYEESGGEKVDKKTPCWLKALIWTFVVILILCVLLFVVLFGVVPIIFMCSIEFQRLLIFPNAPIPKNPQYNNPELYDMQGVRNLYVVVDDLEHADQKISLGIWQLVPEDEIATTIDFDEALLNSAKPIVLFFHGNSGTRIKNTEIYKVMRKYFHILAFDYRSYGDSTDAELTETGIVQDSVQLYKWVLTKTRQQQIYVWGHSLGTAVSAHTLKILKNQDNMVPMGLMLEAPFTTMAEELSNYPLGQIFAWLPWFGVTVLDPVYENGFRFESTTNILDIDCPIMILHAEDDNTIPYYLGSKLYDVASNERDETQGKAMYHQFDEKYNCGHSEIYKHPDLPKHIEELIEVSEHHWLDNEKKP